MLILFLLALPVVAAELPPTTPQNVSFSECTRGFKIPPEKLFYLAIAGISANRFSIQEIQSKNGYILFNAANKEFLATVSKNSLLKITPADNSYYFAPGIVLNIFKYIELNSVEELKTLPVRG
jgi:hypothetical protein